MELKVDEEILKAYGFTSTTIKLQQIGSGHINRTYLLLTEDGDKYVLQRLNTSVFTQPHLIASNLKKVSNELTSRYPFYLFPAPLPTKNGDLLATVEKEHWRLLPFVADAISFDALSDPKQAYEAAKQFGKLTRLLDKFDTSTLKPTIQRFHDLNLRYQQFIEATEQAQSHLKEFSANEIKNAISLKSIVQDYTYHLNNPDFPDRVIHHDTKISNVLLNEEDHTGVCVIDLDTLMGGKYISDVGDMMRTYLCEFSEDEKDLGKIKIRLPYFKATISGYLSEMAIILTPTEKKLILFSGKFIIYMQALRFLTDYLNGSVYYPISYDEHNLDRAKNQFKLLSELFKNEDTLQSIIDECLLSV